MKYDYIHITCDKCGRRYEIKNPDKQKRYRCGECKHLIIVEPVLQDKQWPKLTMNKKQKNTLLISIVIFVVTGILPPYDLDGSLVYAPLFLPPTHQIVIPNSYITKTELTEFLEKAKKVYGLNNDTDEETYESEGMVDYSRLFLQWGILLISVFGFWIYFREDKQTEGDGESNKQRQDHQVPENH